MVAPEDRGDLPGTHPIAIIGSCVLFASSVSDGGRPTGGLKLTSLTAKEKTDRYGVPISRRAFFLCTSMH